MMIEAKHYSDGRIVRIYHNSRVSISTEAELRKESGSALDWLAPSFFDPQINGALGIWFNAPGFDCDKAHKVVRFLREHGIGGFCPTVITDASEIILHAFRSLVRAIGTDPDLMHAMPCFHLEGPYIASDDGPRGAHPGQHIRNPDWDEFRRWQDAAEGRIRMITLAPERPGALDFIEQACKQGIVVAIGHTAANCDQLSNAVSAGACTSTHLGNGSHANLPRHDNYIWHQLANDRLNASLITDGHHLHPSAVKCMIRAKGVHRTMITCDASSLAGLPTGVYREWGTDVEIQPDGKIVLRGTPYLAGSGVLTDTCVSNVLTMADVNLSDAVTMASINTRRLLGIPLPSIEAFEARDWIRFRWQPDGPIHQLRFA